MPRDRDPGLQRGYRDHYQPRTRSRSPRRDRSPPRNNDKAERSDSKQERKEPTEKKEKKVKKPAAVAAPQQPMILVTVNDRLGTKKAIPCFASDSVSELYPQAKKLSQR